MVKFFNKSGKLSAIPNKIYKGEVIRDWNQPKLSHNISNESFQIIDPYLSNGTMVDSTGVMTWGSSSVTRFTQIPNAINNNGYWAVNSGNKIFSVFDVVFKNLMLVSGVYILGNVIGSVASSLTGSQIYGFDSNNNLTLLSSIAATNTNTHTFTPFRTKRLRICARPNSDGGSYPSRITNINITAKEIFENVYETHYLIKNKD